MKQTVANMQTELNEFEARIEGELGNYLPLSGGTMTGPINMGNQALRDASAISLNGDTTSPSPGDITGINELKFKPSGAGKIASGIYFVDNDQKINGVFELYSRRGNDRYAGIRAYGVILNNYNSAIASSAISEAYIRLDTPQDENTAVINFMAKVDNSTYGRVILNGIVDPVTDYNAANKHYVDTVGENLASEIAQVGGQFENYLPLSGGQMRGALDMNFENVENMRRMGFGEAGYSRYYALFEDETLKLIKENITSSSIGYFNVDCGTITSWVGLMNIGIRLSASGNSTKTNPVLDITGTTDSAKVRVTNIATPISDDDVATKGYVDSADEGFLYVDGGQLYEHRDTPQGVLLDKIDFASQGVEEAGVATLSISGTTGNLVMSILDESLTHVPLRFGVGELTDGSAGVNMAVLGKYMRGGVSESVTSANVKATDLLTGLYIVRYVSEVYMVNVTGYELGELKITSSKIMGTDGGITFTTEVVDVNTMKLTFSSALESGFQVTKLTGGAYVEVSILS